MRGVISRLKYNGVIALNCSIKPYTLNNIVKMEKIGTNISQILPDNEIISINDIKEISKLKRDYKNIKVVCLYIGIKPSISIYDDVINVENMM